MHLFQMTVFMNDYLIAIAQKARAIFNFDFFMTVIAPKAPPDRISLTINRILNRLNQNLLIN